jgi:HTH-type transcriptional regulator/antitoxin HigA
MSPKETWRFDGIPVHPGKLLQRMLDHKGWTQDELASITGKARQTIGLLVAGKSGVTPDMAIALAAAFSETHPTDWMKWDAAYRLSVSEAKPEEIQKMARLYEIAPVKDMAKRGWISESKSVDQLEIELKAFFGTDLLTEEPTFTVATRRARPLSILNAAEMAWCFRARQLACALHPTGPFKQERLNVVQEKLRSLAAYPKEARHITKLLADFGIRFVVVEPLPNAKIDGAAFWLDEQSPVIAVSVRYDRNDAFWFTVMHEFVHIKNGDALSVDTDLVGGEDTKNGPSAMTPIEDEQEGRANHEAANALVPSTELDSFIRRVGPLYSKVRIVQFAHRIKIHPGIIVGQLQHRGEIAFRTNREMLAKIREAVTETALTDGWGKAISPGIL